MPSKTKNQNQIVLQYPLDGLKGLKELQTALLRTISCACEDKDGIIENENFSFSIYQVINVLQSTLDTENVKQTSQGPSVFEYKIDDYDYALELQKALTELIQHACACSEERVDGDFGKNIK